MSAHDNWEAVRILDDAENWAERNEVLFKEDHTELVHFAKDIIRELVNNLPICAKQEYESMVIASETALLDMDYLETLKVGSNLDSSTSGRDSIYAKFDPLVKEMPLKVSDVGTVIPCETFDKRDLVDLDTPHSWKGVKQFQGNFEECNFSGLEVVSGNNESHATDNSTTSQASHEDLSAVSVTSSSLVKILKYSDEDLLKLVQLAKRRAGQRERQKIEAQLHEVKEMIIAARGQMQSHYESFYALDSTRDIHLLQMDRIREEERRTKDRVITYNQRIRERSTNFHKLRKQKTNFEFYEALLLQDQTQLENIFDELHSCHVKQKELNKGLVIETEEIESHLADVHEWHQRASEQHSTLLSKKEAIEEGFKQTYQAIQNEYETKLAIERTKTKKLQLKMKSLREDLILVKQDKEQLAQICDDLMKQLELNTRET